MSTLLRKAEIVYRWGFLGLLAIVLLLATWSPVLANDATNREARRSTESESSKFVNPDHFKFVCEPRVENITIYIPEYNKVFTGSLKEGWYMELYSWGAAHEFSYYPWSGNKDKNMILGQLFDLAGNKFGNQLYQIIPSEWRCTLFIGEKRMVEKIYPRSGGYASSAEFALKEESIFELPEREKFFQPEESDDFYVGCFPNYARALHIYSQPSKKIGDENDWRTHPKKIMPVYGLVTHNSKQYLVAEIYLINNTYRLPFLVPPSNINNYGDFMLYDEENDIATIAPFIYVQSFGGLQCLVIGELTDEWDKNHRHETAMRIGFDTFSTKGGLEALNKYRYMLAKFKLRDEDYQVLRENFENFQIRYDKSVVEIWLPTDQERR